jgi:FkbM family methyltransferase
MDNSWVLGLPGLRRFREQLRRLDRLRDHAERQRRRIDELERALARERGKHARVERLLLSAEPIEHTLRARHHALLHSARRDAAAAREQEFAAATASYLAELRSESLAADATRLEQVSVAGLTFWVPRSDGDAGGLADRMVRKGWLPFADILKGRELGVGTIMLDIGANIGTTAIPRVVAGDVQCVYAAEPDPLNYACLVRNIRNNRLGGFVLPDRVAISDSDGEAWLERAGGMGTQQLTARTAQAGAASPLPGVIVQTLSLDNWVKRLGVQPELISLVKSDTQGWESHVLSGARQLLAHRHIAWIVEFSPGYLKRAGSGPARLTKQIEEHFTHFVDLRGGDDGTRVKDTGQLERALAYVTERREERYTDLLLYNAG